MAIDLKWIWVILLRNKRTRKGITLFFLKLIMDQTIEYYNRRLNDLNTCLKLVQDEYNFKPDHVLTQMIELLVKRRNAIEVAIDTHQRCMNTMPSSIKGS